MDLKDFVETTLVQIAQGIASANSTLQEGQTGAVINPLTTSADHDQSRGARPVEFDVALTVVNELSSREGSSTGGKAGILAVASIAGDLKSEQLSGRREEAVSRVRFAVHMLQPSNITVRPTPRIPSNRVVV